MTPAQLALGVAAVVGLVNAAFVSVAAYELSDHSMAVGAVAALVVLVAESILVKTMGAKIGAQLNEAMAPGASR